MKLTFHTVLTSWKNILNYIFLAAGTMMFFLFNTAVASEPKPWQMDLQEPAGIIATKATDLHNFLLVVCLPIMFHHTLCLLPCYNRTFFVPTPPLLNHFNKYIYHFVFHG